MPPRPEERMTEEETYQRRIDTGEWTPDAMTDEERLSHRRFEAGHAFEMNAPPVKRSRLDHFGLGIAEQQGVG